MVGDSRTGEMDRIDGIYYGFGAIQKLAAALPRWARLPVPRIRGRFNVVPVDYVADALVHIALSPGAARVYHLVDPRPQRFVRMTTTLVKAAGGPELGPAIDISKIPAAKQAAAMASMLPSVQELRGALLEDFGVPSGALGVMNMRVRFDDANTRAALRDSGIECPHFKSYAKLLFRYYEDRLDPMTDRPSRYRKALAGKTVLVTGASRGIGAAAARIAADAGARVLLVARGKEALDTFGDSLASEMYHDGVHVSSVYLPLVKTETMAPTEEYSGRVDIMTPERAALMVLDGVVDRKRRVMTREGRIHAISNRIMPMTTTRLLNVIRRAFPIGDAKSEFPTERAMITKAIGGSPI